MPTPDDQFPGTSSIDLLGPANDFEVVTPSDTEDLSKGVTRAIRVGTGGDLKVTSREGTTGVIPNVQDGETVYGRFTRVWQTGTTADDIIAWY